MTTTQDKEQKRDVISELSKFKINEPQDRMLHWFGSRHLSITLQMTADLFEQLANDLVSEVHAGPERTVSLQKLLQARDAALRATIHPGR